MKAVRLNELGGPEKLHVEEVPEPKPSAGEILVKVGRAAFNRRDVYITHGLYPGIKLPTMVAASTPIPTHTARQANNQGLNGRMR